MRYQILVGVNGSQNADQALRWAIEEAALRDGEVTALFAWQYPLVGIPGAFNRDELEQKAKDFVNGQLEEVEVPEGVNVNTIVAQGDASESLLHACDEIGADLLVLGSRARDGFVGMLLGSVVDCAAHAPCPVVMINALGRNGARS